MCVCVRELSEYVVDDESKVSLAPAAPLSKLSKKGSACGTEGREGPDEGTLGGAPLCTSACSGSSLLTSSLSHARRTLDDISAGGDELGGRALQNAMANQRAFRAKVFIRFLPSSLNGMCVSAHARIHTSAVTC